MLEVSEIYTNNCGEMRTLLEKQGVVGPWMKEPDRLEFRHRGFTCLLLRNSETFVWCGYVGITKRHPKHGVSYSDADLDLLVHGGLTYSGNCAEHICHKPAPGEPDDVWWFGFDCGHAYDTAPGRMISSPELRRLTQDAVYRDMEYAKGQVMKLAEQLYIPSGMLGI